VKRAVATAEAAGFIVMHVNGPKAMLTAKDRHAAKR
jgi:hypothetical protein